jgi:hypothetical protein
VEPEPCESSTPASPPEDPWLEPHDFLTPPAHSL